MKSKIIKKFNITHFSSLPSTNAYLKELAINGAPSFTVISADIQSAGQGRMGHSFASPKGGLYFSILLRPSEDLSSVCACDCVNLTALTAVAVSESIEKLTDKKMSIKWVNDIYFKNKKVCGILAEGAYNTAGNALEYIVIGIGINIYGSFEETELNDIATVLYKSLDEDKFIKLKNQLITEITVRLYKYYTFALTHKNKSVLKKYKKRLFILGKKAEVFQNDFKRNAEIIKLNDDFTLQVKYENGEISSLNSGEVHLKLK